MGVPVIDSAGNLHRGSGVGGGQFEPRVTSPPTAPLDAPWAEDLLRSKFTALWSQIRGDGEGGGLSSEAKRSVLDVALRRLTSEQAPVAVEVSPGHADGGAAEEYRRVDGDLFRQVFQEPAEPSHEQVPSPVVADEAWLTSAAEEYAREVFESGVSVRGPGEMQALVQERMNAYAAVDGEVWRRSAPPVYRVPQADLPSAGTVPPGADDGLFDDPVGEVGVVVSTAPDTTSHAAVGYYPASQLEEALEDADATAARLGVPSAPRPLTPPIVWLTELGLVDEGSWREGARLSIDPSSALTTESFAERFEHFRRQIAEHLPDAISGDVGAFQVVPRVRLDTSALTETQHAEYRRYVMFGLEHGLL